MRPMLVVGCVATVATGIAISQTAEAADDFLSSVVWCKDTATICRKDGTENLFPGVRLYTDLRLGATVPFRPGELDIAKLSLAAVKTPVVGIELGVYQNILALDVAYVPTISVAVQSSANVLLRAGQTDISTLFGLYIGASAMGGVLSAGVLYLNYDPSSFQPGRGSGSFGGAAFTIGLQPISAIRSAIGSQLKK